MPPLPQIVETGVLVLAAYLIGCVLGFALRRLTARAQVRPEPVKATAPPPRPRPVETPAEQFASIAGLKTTPAQRLAASIEAAAREKAAAAAKSVTVVTSVEAPPKIEAAESVPPVLAVAEPAHSDPIPPRDPAAIAAETAPAVPPPPAGPPKPHAVFGRPTPLAAPRDGGKDNLKLVKGIGPRIERGLNELGIFHFDQIAAWDRKTVVWVETHFSFKGRVERERWVLQARELARGSVKTLRSVRA